MSLTNEQIKAILDSAPEGEQHINIPVAGGLTHKVHRIDDLREILALRQEAERFKAELDSVCHLNDSLSIELNKLREKKHNRTATGDEEGRAAEYANQRYPDKE